MNEERSEEKKVLFVDGMSFFKPNEGAPDFIRGTISVDPNKLIAFFKENKQYMSEKGYFKIDVKKSKKGSLYLALNTYKKPEEVVVDKNSDDFEIPF